MLNLRRTGEEEFLIGLRGSVRGPQEGGGEEQ